MITSVCATALAGLSSTKQSSSGSVELHGAHFRGWNKYAGTYPAKMSSFSRMVHKFVREWGTCTSSCGCAKIRKTGCERLPGWHRVRWVAWGPSDTIIFEREAVRALQKTAPVFVVLAMETLPRASASPEDCSHVGALQVLVTALRSKRPSAWLFTSWCCTCWGGKSMWRARRQNLLRG